jgi:hypothetical protein
MDNNQIIEAMIDTTDQRPFELCQGTPKEKAQRQLDGKTYYVTDSTLKYFQSRILSALPVANGLFYKIIESLPQYGLSTSKRLFRATVFDVFGDVVYHVDLEDMSPTLLKADKAFYQWYESFNAIEYYIRKFSEKANEHNRQYTRMKTFALKLDEERTNA